MADLSLQLANHLPRVRVKGYQEKAVLLLELPGVDLHLESLIDLVTFHHLMKVSQLFDWCVVLSLFCTIFGKLFLFTLYCTFYIAPFL